MKPDRSSLVAYLLMVLVLGLAFHQAVALVGDWEGLAGLAEESS